MFSKAVFNWAWFLLYPFAIILGWPVFLYTQRNAKWVKGGARLQIVTKLTDA
jgi:hypothetical protein